MNAIPIKELHRLALALPKSLITPPNSAGCSFIIDRGGGKIGDINWQTQQITIYREYEYSAEVCEAIGGVVEREIDFSTSNEMPVNTEGEEPFLTDYGKQLYGKPTNDG